MGDIECARITQFRYIELKSVLNYCCVIVFIVAIFCVITIYIVAFYNLHCNIRLCSPVAAIIHHIIAVSARKTILISETWILATVHITKVNALRY